MSPRVRRVLEGVGYLGLVVALILLLGYLSSLAIWELEQATARGVR